MLTRESLESANSGLDYFRDDLGRSSDTIWRYVRFNHDEAGELRSDWRNVAEFITEDLERVKSKLKKELSG